MHSILKIFSFSRLIDINVYLYLDAISSIIMNKMAQLLNQTNQLTDIIKSGDIAKGPDVKLAWLASHYEWMECCISYANKLLQCTVRTSTRSLWFRFNLLLFDWICMFICQQENVANYCGRCNEGEKWVSLPVEFNDQAELICGSWDMFLSAGHFISITVPVWE